MPIQIGHSTTTTSRVMQNCWRHGTVSWRAIQRLSSLRSTWAITPRIYLTSLNAWTAFPICTWSWLHESGSSAASRAWPEGSSRNIRIEFFLALTLSLTERTRLNRSSMISCMRFITAFLKPTTNISIMPLRLYLLRGGGGFTASVYLMEYSRRCTTRMPRGYCKSQDEQFSEYPSVNRAITRRIGDSL